VFSIWDGEKFIATWRASTEWQRTADQYYVWPATLMRFQNVDVMIGYHQFAVPRVNSSIYGL
jgi:type III pantothenate kinase